MCPSDLLKNHRDEILALAAKAGASNVRVFGSAARVDVISPEQLHPRFRPRVLAQARPV